MDLFPNCSQSRSHSRTQSQSRSHSRAWSQKLFPKQHTECMSHVPWWTPIWKESNLQEPQSGNKLQERCQRLLHRALCLWCGDMAGMAGQTAGHPCLVDGTPSHSGYKRPPEAAQKIRASFYIPEVRMRTLLEPGFTTPPMPRSPDRNAFLPNDLSYQDMWQNPALLMIAYARSLQYWVEKQSLPRSRNLHTLAESVVELQEAVNEYVIFNYRDIIRDLGATHNASPTHEPHTPIFSHMLSSPSEEQVRGATTHASSTVTKGIRPNILLHQPEQRGKTLVCCLWQPV